MTVRGGFSATLAALLVVGACAPAATTGGGGDTRFSRAATLQIAQAQVAEGERAQELYRQALDNSLQGIEDSPENAQHFLLAGQAYAGLGDVEGADSMFVRALEMHPDFATDIAISREQAWAELFNQGVTAYNAGDHDEAVQQWEGANRIFDGRPEAFFNLAAVYSQREEYDQAIGAFERAVSSLDQEPARELDEEEIAERQESLESALQNLGQLQLFTEQFGEAERTYRRLTELQPESIAAQSSLAAAIAQQGRHEDAAAVYQRLMAAPDLSAEDLMSIGVGLWQSEQFTEAEQAFRRITEMAPESRDGWYNYLQALYAQDKYQEIIPVAERVLELDPLSETVHLILGRSHRELQQQQRALQVLQANEAHPVHVQDMTMRVDDGRAMVSGRVIGNQASAGTPIRLEFTFAGPTGEVGRETVTVSAPAQGQATDFRVSPQTSAAPTGYR
jgi:tetratricopeptide (TPR) repeat protein